MPTMRSSPGLEDIWQLHWSYNAGIEQNSAGVFIANVDDAATIANVLTAPPRGGGPGGGRTGGPPAAAGAPPAGVTPQPASPPAAAAPAAGPAPQAPGAAAPAGGGGRGAAAAAAAHTPAYWIKLSVQPDGTFTVTNSRNGFSKTYVKRR
jgi:hypothetical protein